MALERIVEFDPAYDHRQPDPKQNFGIHGVQVRFVLKGERGAVQFLLYTSWQLPHVAAEYRAEFMAHPDRVPVLLFEPMPADLGYHSPVPMYEGHEPMGSSITKWVDPPEDNPEDFKKVPQSEPTGTFTPCPYLNALPCYYDGSTLNARPVFEALLMDGDAGVWRNLENYYRQVFEEQAEEVLRLHHNAFSRPDPTASEQELRELWVRVH